MKRLVADLIDAAAIIAIVLMLIGLLLLFTGRMAV